MTGIVIIARLGSTRLSRKHLIESGGRTFIEWLVTRFQTYFQKEIFENTCQVFIATVDTPENKIFEKLFNNKGVQIFYGSESNIPLRLLECAQRNNLDYIISIDGDDILCSPSAARQVWEKAKEGWEFAQSVGLPLGMNVAVYNTNFLQESLKQHMSTAKLETGWGRIFEQTKPGVVNLGDYQKQEQLRFTLDYEADALFFDTIITQLGEKIISMQDEEIIAFVNQHGYHHLNSNLNNTYWENFSNQKNQEIK